MSNWPSWWIATFHLEGMLGEEKIGGDDWEHDGSVSRTSWEATTTFLGGIILAAHLNASGL